MQIITTTEDLARFCSDCATAPYVTVDTEFLRERTYYAQLCLVQLARPAAEGEDDEASAAIVDPLAKGLSLEPLFELMRNTGVMKVFHAARQDLEIFYTLMGSVPEPIFDSQVAAMVCGLGDQASYESLVRRVARQGMDKSARFTDWSRRPLSEKQLSYAIADVTHLRVIYEALSAQLAESGRTAWVDEEMAILTSPATYDMDPEEAWRRVKTRTTAPKFLAVVRELAAWRERQARERDVPRNRLLKDDALLEIASNKPTTLEELGRSRLLQREGRRNDMSDGILRAVAAGIACPPDKRPVVPEPFVPKPGGQALGDLLRVLLKAKAEASGVAPRLIASSADLDRIASGEDADVPAMSGWRHEVFGGDAERLREGRIALSADQGGVKLIEI
ncbi:ribonuclease D [Paroceanicella profunda]|uniref:Ribonuclease D n=1 Tax=Paroceanicella profunda TaxID=2579971 RepID=A0A5B8FV00_9RHOB|nr:ribonuclease D [Paroceanicella profunda]QDL92606.1 ribonuclease D [Paroceanicella profunda]